MKTQLYALGIGGKTLKRTGCFLFGFCLAGVLLCQSQVGAAWDWELAESRWPYASSPLHVAGSAESGRLYVGTGTGELCFYNLDLRQWEDLPPPPAPPEPIAALLQIPDFLFASVGSRICRYELSSGQWSSLPSYADRWGRVHDLAWDSQKQQVLVASDNGLWAVPLAEGSPQRIRALPETACYQILITQSAHYAVNAQGIGCALHGAGEWQQSLQLKAASMTLEELYDEDFDEAPEGASCRLAAVPAKESEAELWAVGQGRFWRLNQEGQWESEAAQGLPAEVPADLAVCPGELEDSVLALVRGQIWEGIPGSNSWEELHAPQPGELLDLAFLSGSVPYLAAVGARGFFLWQRSEPRAVAQNSGVDTHRWFEWIENEPCIEEVQDAAERVANVRPGQIRAWRRRLAWSAWLPSVSIDWDTDQTVGDRVDEGTFPVYQVMDVQSSGDSWGVGLRWDMTELIWSGDEISIDGRSRLRAQLRDEILRDVNRLYYERRRQQLDWLQNSADSQPLTPDGLHEILKLQELTAALDSLTGGEFRGRWVQPLELERDS
ncbi:MAG: hypothetical protein JW937_04070 [Candidatus Omnitrophica bacterium]|nr:hypothetical protein [Candidatus Omnitrophota bacterium]